MVYLDLSDKGRNRYKKIAILPNKYKTVKIKRVLPLILNKNLTFHKFNVYQNYCYFGGKNEEQRECLEN